MKTDTQIIKVTVDPDGDTKEIQCVPADFARQMERERDEAREAYEAETASTIELVKRIMQLESEVNHWRNKHSELFMAANPIAKDCPPADTGYACDYARHKRDVPCGICPLKSQREAAGTADEKPDGQAENAATHAPGANEKPLK